MAVDTTTEVTTPAAAAEITTTVEEAVKNDKVEGKIENQKNRIQVSNTKKPLFFYINLAKRYIKQHDDVELSALGMAIPTVVIIAEILKRNGLATEKKVLTSTVGSKDEVKGRLVQKAKIEIVLVRTENGVKPKTTAATSPKKNADKIEIVIGTTPNGDMPKADASATATEENADNKE